MLAAAALVMRASQCSRGQVSPNERNGYSSCSWAGSWVNLRRSSCSSSRRTQGGVARLSEAPSAPAILVGGENLIDFIQTSEDDAALPTYKANPGGGPYNTAKALARQLRSTGGTPAAATVGYLTPISNDSLGELLARGLEEAGAQLLAARRSEPTSLAVVSLQGGIPSYQFYRERTAERMVTLESLRGTVPANAVALQLGSLALTAGEDADIWAEFYCAMKEAGLFTSLDPNIRAAFIHNREAFLARLDRVLAHTDLLKLSDEDLRWILPDAPSLQHAALELLGRSSAGLVVVTLGGEGAFALQAGGGRDEVSVLAAPLGGTLRDTVGAGDTFSGTLLSSLASDGRLSGNALRAMSCSEVAALLKRASGAAAINCQRVGCDPPTREEVDAMMADMVPGS